jgi:hypothetical protein
MLEIFYHNKNVQIIYKWVRIWKLCVYKWKKIVIGGLSFWACENQRWNSKEMGRCWKPSFPSKKESSGVTMYFPRQPLCWLPASAQLWGQVSHMYCLSPLFPPELTIRPQESLSCSASPFSLCPSLTILFLGPVQWCPNPNKTGQGHFL